MELKGRQRQETEGTLQSHSRLTLTARVWLLAGTRGTCASLKVCSLKVRVQVTGAYPHAQTFTNSHSHTPHRDTQGHSHIVHTVTHTHSHKYTVTRTHSHTHSQVQHLLFKTPQMVYFTLKSVLLGARQVLTWILSLKTPWEYTTEDFK